MRNAVCRELGTLRKVWIVTENYQNEWQQILWLFIENSHFLITKSLTEKIIYKSLKRKADIKLGSVVSDWQITKIVSHMNFFSCMVSRKNGLVSTWTQLSSFLWLLFCFTFMSFAYIVGPKKRARKQEEEEAKLFLVTGLRIIYCINFFPGHFSFTGVGKVLTEFLWSVFEILK